MKARQIMNDSRKVHYIRCNVRRKNIETDRNEAALSFLWFQLFTSRRLEDGKEVGSWDWEAWRVCVCVWDLCVLSLHFLNQSNLHEIWHENYVTGDHPNLELPSFLQRPATSCTVWGSNPSRGKIFSLPQNRQDHFLGLRSLLFNENLCYFPEVKRPEHELGHSPPSSAEVKNKWSYTSYLPTCLHGVNSDSFNFNFFFFLQLIIKCLTRERCNKISTWRSVLRTTTSDRQQLYSGSPFRRLSKKQHAGCANVLI